MKKIPIIEWEDRNADVTKGILRLAWGPIDDIIAGVEARQPFAVIPPYSQDSRYSARCAASIRDRLQSIPGNTARRILCAVNVNDPRIARQFLSSLSDGGFKNFAFPATIGKIPLNHLFNTVGEHLWFHIAGGKPPKAEFVGNWTWSEEGL
jgi:hypothetical protein